MFSGEIASIFFSNPANFYKVLLLEIDDTDADFEDSEIVVTGTIGDVVEGESYVFWGTMTTHPKYGLQLTATRYEKSLPTTNAALVRFFSGEQFPGIGKATAEKIVAAYPTDTIASLLKDPSALKNLLSLAKRESFVKRLKESVGTDRTLAELQKYGLPGNVNLRMIELYGEEAISVIEKTPYRLVEDIRGVGFKLADRIAADEGVAADDSGRLRAGLLHVLVTRAMATGDTYMIQVELLQGTQILLSEARPVEISEEMLETELTQLAAEGKIQRRGEKIFENSLYFAEEAIAASLKKLAGEPAVKFDKAQIDAAIAQAEEKLAIHYDETQKTAISEAIGHSFSLLTGGPGTGKTTIVQGLIEVYAELHEISLDVMRYSAEEPFPIVLAAPTGRAARRLSETTGLPAATLHRHLGIATDDAVDSETSALVGDLLIVDEFSMVDTWLGAKLFRAIPDGMQVVCVGDADQLPSVGPGQVFADLFKLPNCAATELIQVYRQSEKSTILDLAASIKAGALPSNLTERQSDRSFFAASANQVPHLIQQIAESWLRRGNDPFELQVLAPMYKGAAGIDALNEILQEVFNPLETDAIEFNYKAIHFRRGDKILHLVNDAEAGVFNGDIGRITDLVAGKYTESKQDELLLDFDGQEVVYPRSDWYKLTLAYAMSIHKAQGSEFATVVVPLVANFSRMLQRNLLYTAVTRARESLILLGEVSAFEQAVARVSGNRKTYLVPRLTGKEEAIKSDETSSLVSEASVKFDNSPNQSLSHPVKFDKASGKQILTQSSINAGEISPLIGLTDTDFALLKP